MSAGLEPPCPGLLHMSYGHQVKPSISKGENVMLYALLIQRLHTGVLWQWNNKGVGFHRENAQPSNKRGLEAILSLSWRLPFQELVELLSGQAGARRDHGSSGSVRFEKGEPFLGLTGTKKEATHLGGSKTLRTTPGPPLRPFPLFTFVFEGCPFNSAALFSPWLPGGGAGGVWGYGLHVQFPFQV